MKAEAEAYAVLIGRTVAPAEQLWSEVKLGFAETLKQMITSGNWGDFTSIAMQFGANVDIARDKVQHLAATMNAVGDAQLQPVETTKKLLENYQGLSDVLDSVRWKISGLGDEESKAAAEQEQVVVHVQKAIEALQEKHAKGDISDTVFERELEAGEEVAKLLPDLYGRLMAQIAEKRKLAAEQATADLQARIQGQQQAGFAAEYAAWDDEIAKLRENYAKKGELTTQNEALIAALHTAGTEKIRRDQLQTFQQELVDLQGHLAQIVTANMISQERLEFQRDQDLAKYSEVELGKTEAFKAGGAQRQTIEAQFSLNRSAVLKKYQTDLQALQNSQGWQGVFGAKFAQGIRGNEALMREWATSSNQSLLSVKVTMESLKEMGQGAFADLAQGMGQNIASAIVYQKSIGDAMRSALASTLESIASQSITYAIYSLALGFTRLAEHDPVGASAAFTAAAIWGSVGAVAAVAGRVIAPSQAGRWRVGRGFHGHEWRGGSIKRCSIP